MPKLHITKGAGIGRDRPLETECVLGRAADADLVVEDLAASRRHARVAKEGDAYVVRDLGSRNGTYVNGQRVQAASLNDGDLIRIGGTEVVFRASDAPSAPAPSGVAGPVPVAVAVPKPASPAASPTVLVVSRPPAAAVPAPAAKVAAVPAPAAKVAAAPAPAAAPAAAKSAAPPAKPAAEETPKKPLPNVVPRKRRGVF